MSTERPRPWRLSFTDPDGANHTYPCLTKAEAHAKRKIARAAGATHCRVYRESDSTATTEPQED